MDAGVAEAAPIEAKAGQRPEIPKSQRFEVLIVHRI